MNKVILGLFCVLTFACVDSVGAESFVETEDVTISPDFCSLYPLTLPHALLSSAQAGQNFTTPLGTGPGNYSWLSWRGKNDANSVAAALVPPGNSRTYINPDNASDNLINVGDWVEGAPGVKNAKAIRNNMDALVGRNIIVPVWGGNSGQGANLNYRVSNFAVVRIQDYKLNGKGYLSFEFERFTRCYNHRPEALNSQVITNEDTVVEFDLETRDTDGDELVFEILAHPTHGTLTRAGGRVTYTPELHYFGPDSVLFRVHDGEQISGSATVSIDVVPVNDRPKADPGAAVGPEDTPILLNFSGSDVELSELSFRVVTPPTHGAVVESDEGLIYLPELNYTGPDLLEYISHDGELDSVPARYELTVTPVNDAPTARDVEAETEGGDSVAIALLGADVDSEQLIYSLYNLPSHGTFTGDAPNLVYTPHPQFEGLEVLTYHVSDGELQATATITINVIQPNLPPVITTSPVVRTPERSLYSYAVAASDPNEDVLTFGLDLGPEQMMIDPSTGIITWPASTEYTQSVPTFNKQCYVVPTGSVKEYEEGDDAAGPSYIAPLFYRVRGAISDASDYVAPQAVAWHNQNKCLGCHIQTQSLLGMQSSKDKADVDEQTAEYLLTEILSSQLSDGSIRRSHPGYTKNQTAFALWALNAVPERERTFSVREKGLEFFKSRVTVSGDRAYWTTDHASGWLRTSLAITALNAQSAAGYLGDIDALDNLTPEQQTLSDFYRMLMPSMAEHLLAGITTNENDSLRRVFRLVGLAEIKPFINSPEQLARIDDAIELLDLELRSRQKPDGGWSKNATGSESDPLTSAWVGLALDYQHPEITDPAIINNIEYLLDSQQANGTWDTNSGLFTTKLATTSLVMAYLPVALDHLGNPDVRLGHVSIQTDGNGFHQLSVELSNRGLANITSPLDIEFYAGAPEDGVLLGTAQSAGLASGADRTSSILVSDVDLTKDISVALSSGSNVDECEINNNATRAALVRLHVSDPDGLKDTQIYALNVEDVNEAPTIESDPQLQLEGGQSFEYQVEVSDTDVGDAHTYELTSGPEGLYIDERTGRFTSAPGGLAPGEYTVTVLVTDLRGATVEQTFTLTISENLPPHIVSSAVVAAVQGDGYRYEVEATDPNEGDLLGFGLEYAPEGMSIDQDAGVIQWAASDEWVDNRLDSNSLCVASPNLNAKELSPVEKWSWQRSARYPDSNQVMMTPIVGQFTDDNNDGVIDDSDGNDIAFTTFELYNALGYSAKGHIRIVDGNSGEEINVFDEPVEAYGSLAVADIDGDGRPEILAPRVGGNLVAFEDNGTIKWQIPGSRQNNYHGASIADLDGDSQVEILWNGAVYDGHGELLWKADLGFIGGRTSHGGFGVAADLDLDGSSEVLFGPSVYSETGDLIWSDAKVGDGFTGVADFDADGSPEVVLVGNGMVHLYGADGELLWSSSILGGGFGGPPTIADFDGDGEPEIGVAGAHNYVVIDSGGSELWHSPTRDESSNFTGSSVFDFDGDGAAEVVYSDEYFLRVYRGKDGAVLFERRNTSATTMEMPIVADVDGDSFAELVAVSNQYLQVNRGQSLSNTTFGVKVFEGAGSEWAPTRATWNQHAYNINNINDDLTVPANPESSWLTHNTFRLNTFADRDALSLPDVTVSGITYDNAGGTASVTVLNRGLAPVDGPLTVTFAHDHFWTGEEVLGQVSIDGLKAGERTVVSLAADDSIVLQALKAVVELPADTTECATDNNETRAAIVDTRVYDEAGLFDKQKFAISITDINDEPVFKSAASSSAAVGELYSFQLEVIDPDKGDAHTFAISDAPEGIELNELTGKVSAADLAEGIYSYTLTATDLSGAVAEQVHVLTVAPADNMPPVFDTEAPTTVTGGDTYRYDVVASDPDGDEVVYLLSRSQPGMLIDGVSGRITWATESDLSGVFSAEVTALDTRGASTKQYFLIEVSNPNDSNQPPTITSSPKGAVYAGQKFSYQVTANDPDGDELTFSLPTGVAGMAISESGLFTWLAAPELIGETVIAQVLVDDSRGGVASQKLTLPVNESANHPPRIISTPDLQALVGDSYSYLMAAVDDDGDAFTFSLDQAPNGMTLSGNTLSWTPAISQAGAVHDVIVRVTDSRGAASIQSFGIGVNAPVVSNAPPQIQSIPTSPAFVGEQYQYDVVARDADGDALMYSLEAGPSGMTLNAVGEVRWVPADDQIGDHTIRVRVTDGKAWATQSFTLTAVEITENNYPDIVSKPSTLAVAGQPYQYQLVATDADGDPLTFGSMIAPEGMTVDQTGLASWTPQIDQIGIHDVSYYADDGKGRTLQSTTINVQEAPLPLTLSVLATPDRVDVGDTVTIDVFVEGGEGQTTTAVRVDGQLLALSPYGRGYWTATGSGRHTVTAEATDSKKTVTDVAYVTIRAVADNTNPIVMLEGPESGSVVTAPTDIIATIQDDNLAAYEVLITPAGEDQWQVIAEGTTNQQSAPVATFDPSMLTNGQYDVAVLAIDVNGLSASDMMSLQVEGDLKVGNFSITLEDLTIPMAGIPIRVTRTYDSRRRFEALDFGQGWSVGYQDAKVEESRAPGSYWAINQYKRGPYNLILDFCIEPLGAPIVTITLPTGDVERFEVAASPRCNTYQVYKDVELAFNPVGDTQSELVALNDSSARYEDGTLLEKGSFAAPVDPSRYQLTTQAGYVYTLKQDFGIEKVVDPNGNILRYTNDGIFHSSGKAITFQRDSDGRIRAITTPNGDVLNYQYSDEGDLSASADALGNSTEYTYNRSHGLLEIIDPLGNRLVRNIYDDSGRLVAQEDSDGNRTDFNHDIEGRQSVITDRRGNSTLYYYDDRGNVTAKVDAAGNSWNYSYDDRGNQLSQLDPLGNTTSATFDDRNNQLTQTDESGNTVSYTYNTRGQELTITDARGNLYENSYDSLGNLLTVKGPNGDVASNYINAKGLVSKTVDMDGNATSYTYDSDGNKLTETDALGNVARYTYDENGNVLTESLDREVSGSVISETTRYVYDANNRVVETQRADGSTVSTEYDAAGNQTAMVDALGHRTEYAYDAFRRITETYHPDGTVDARTYDAEGNLATEIDRLGRITRYTYDKLNRVIRTDFADGGHSETEYDAAGRVIRETDANGNTSAYEYDAAGRRTAVVDALGNRHSFSYDQSDNLVSETDGNGHATRYAYSALDQRIGTEYHDGSGITETYDPMGRRLSQTDQNGRVTRYEYDALGRLIEVTDALNGTTSYSYDAVGNKLTQTDAEGRVTGWTYDSQGRVLSRTLPMGQTESFTYDAAGNRLTHTDFNGQTTTYQYDLNDRPVLINYGDGTTETFSYDAVGNRLAATTPAGTTQYQYDAMNRLVQEIQPNGAVLGYGYDNAGNRVQLDVSAESETRSTAYEFDKLNRLASVNAGFGDTTYEYDNVGNRASVSYPNGNVTLYEYDALNRLTALTTTDASDAVIADYRYDLSLTGRRSGVQELHTGRITSYEYDELYRLTTEIVADPVNGNYSAEYQYDKVGNRTDSTINGVRTAYSYDANDRLQQQGGSSYSYDANGNTLTETEGGQITRYHYDARNKLIEVKKTGLIASYGYSADGIRTRKTENGQTTNYVVDSNRGYAQVLAEVTNGTEDVRYTYGEDLISQRRGGQAYYYLYDGHGSTRALADGTGSITDRYSYDAFGVLLNRTGDIDNDYLYAGEQLDQNLDQYYLRARYYNQGSGRFTQMDTWMGYSPDPLTLHKYLYANADPVTYTDPSGNISLGSIGATLRVNGILSTSATTAGRSAISRVLTGSSKEAFGIIGEEIIGFAKEALLNILIQEIAGPGFKNAGAKGTAAHQEFEKLIDKINDKYEKYGYTINAEVFRDSNSKSETKKRAKGSLGIDVEVRDSTGKSVLSFDLKTGRGTTKKKNRKLQGVFGSDIIEVFVSKK